MKRHTLEYLINVCNEIYKIPTLVEAYSEFNSNKLIVTSKWNQLDFERNDRVKFEKKHVLQVNDDDCNLDLIHSSEPYQIPNDTITRVKSPNGELIACISNWKDKLEEKQFLEIWNSQSKITNINLTKLNKHGKIYENILEWSQNSSKLAYVAECENKRTETSLINAKTIKNDTNKESIDENNYDEKYSHEYVDEWGEQNVGKSKATIAIFDLNTKNIKIIENLPEHYSPANISWYKNDGLVFSANYIRPYRLGLIYCPIRKSDLFYYDLSTNKCVQITTSDSSVREPRFNHDCTMLCWLENPIGGPHFRCSKLMIINWNTKCVDTLVDIVNSADNSKNEFPGIFSLSLSRHCWSSDNTRILLNSQWNHKLRIISCDIESKQVTCLDGEQSDLSYNEFLHLNKQDWIVALVQSYNVKPSLMIAKLPARGKESEIMWSLKDMVKDNMLSNSIELLQFEPEKINEKYPNEHFEALLVRSKESKNYNNNLVVFPHGGPHSAYACEFNYHVCIFNKLGYSVLMINYRGSTGYGQNNVNSLPGFIGDQDVKDCQQAAEYCMNKYKFNKALLYGGSHGGFLGAHLAGQYPNFYSAVSLRNPVINLDSMKNTSDIPDWIVTEALNKYDFDFKLDELDSESVRKLYECSPIRYVDQVKAPVLLMVGGSDLRVPSSQSVEYYKALKTRGKQVK